MAKLLLLLGIGIFFFSFCVTVSYAGSKNADDLEKYLKDLEDDQDEENNLDKKDAIKNDILNEENQADDDATKTNVDKEKDHAHEDTVKSDIVNEEDQFGTDDDLEKYMNDDLENYLNDDDENNNSIEEPKDKDNINVIPHDKKKSIDIPDDLEESAKKTVHVVIKILSDSEKRSTILAMIEKFHNLFKNSETKNEIKKVIQNINSIVENEEFRNLIQKAVDEHEKYYANKQNLNLTNQIYDTFYSVYNNEEVNHVVNVAVETIRTMLNDVEIQKLILYGGVVIDKLRKREDDFKKIKLELINIFQDRSNIDFIKDIAMLLDPNPKKTLSVIPTKPTDSAKRRHLADLANIVQTAQSPPEVENARGNEISSTTENNGIKNKLVNTVGTVIGTAMNNPIGSAVGNAIGKAVDHPIGSAVGTMVGHAVDNPLTNTVGSLIGHAVDNPVTNTVGSILGNALGKASSLIAIPKNTRKPKDSKKVLTLV